VATKGSSMRSVAVDERGPKEAPRHLRVVAPAEPRSRRRGGPAEAIRRAPTASILLGLTLLLCLVGLVMVGSASSVISLSLYGSPYSLEIREVMWMALGAVGLVLAYRVDYHTWRKFRIPLLVVTLAMLAAVLVGGHSAQGASRWLGVGQLRIQPSELMKLALAIFGADLVARRAQRGARVRAIVMPLALVAGLSAALILMQPDMGTALVIAAITLALIFGSGMPMGPVMKVLGILTGLALVIALLDPYRRARLFAFLDPNAHQSGSGYQVLQSLIGLGSGHLTGLGLGAGRQKWGFLPNAHTDFIFSVVGEEMGLVGALLVLVLLGALAWFGLRAAARAPDRFGSLLAIALVAWLTSETVINVGAVVGLLPVTGIPLPFISFGGSSLVITMFAAGLLMNVARHERRPRRGAASPGVTLRPVS
jgi:cell division protein FtsW